MSSKIALTSNEVKNIAHLARLNLTDHEETLYATQLTQIIDFIAQLDQADTTNIQPLSHSIDMPQRLRPDIVTETNERNKMQAIAPAVEIGFYLVPQVIE